MIIEYFTEIIIFICFLFLALYNKKISYFIGAICSLLTLLIIIFK